MAERSKSGKREVQKKVTAPKRGKGHVRNSVREAKKVNKEDYMRE